MDWVLQDILKIVMKWQSMSFHPRIEETGFADVSAIKLGLQLIVLFYGVEVVIKRMKSRFNIFTISALISLGVLGGRGLL